MPGTTPSTHPHLVASLQLLQELAINSPKRHYPAPSSPRQWASRLELERKETTGMPGVPSYRGCDECRRQKKKCDQAKPACSRCARLSLACVGSGMQRFMFKDETSRLAGGQRDSGRDSMYASRRRGRRQTKSPSSQGSDDSLVRLSRSPSNAMTRMSNSFISVLQIRDPRYDVFCYGHFLDGLPKRMGVNPALDSSMEFFTSAFSCLPTRVPTTEALTKYVGALQALRLCVENGSTACTPETLCAIYILMICQSWIGGHDNMYAGHGEAMVHVLTAAAEQNWSTVFERDVLMTLTITVILQSMCSPELKLNPWLPKIAAICGAIDPLDGVEGEAIPDFNLNHIAALPELFSSPESNMARVMAAYQIAAGQLPQLRAAVLQLEDAATVTLFADVDEPLRSTYIMRTQTRTQTSFGLMITVALVFCRYLQEAYPEDISLVIDALGFIEEAIFLAKICAWRLPLGASHMSLPLIAAWCMAEDDGRRAELKPLLAMYRLNFETQRGQHVYTWFKSAMSTALSKIRKARLMGFYQFVSENESVEGEEHVEQQAACCVM